MTRPKGPARSDARIDARGEGRSALGRLGEEAAARHLAARGYRIVARNVRADRVELDLIARFGAWLVFVEVKSRRGARHGQAAEAVDPRKQRRLRHGAAAWLASRPPEARGASRHRFDVVTCVLLAPEARATGSVDAGADGDGDADARNETSAPEAARWSIEHWEAAF